MCLKKRKKTERKKKNSARAVGKEVRAILHLIHETTLAAKYYLLIGGIVSKQGHTSFRFVTVEQ